MSINGLGELLADNERRLRSVGWSELRILQSRWDLVWGMNIAGRHNIDMPPRLTAESLAAESKEVKT